MLFRSGVLLFGDNITDADMTNGERSCKHTSERALNGLTLCAGLSANQLNPAIRVAFLNDDVPHRIEAFKAGRCTDSEAEMFAAHSASST